LSGYFPTKGHEKVTLAAADDVIEVFLFQLSNISKTSCGTYLGILA
jgi:hypothetical protein